MSLEFAPVVDVPGQHPTVRLAGRDFTVLPLALRQILAIADFVPKLAGISADNLSGERLSPIAEVLWHGLRRGYPGLTRDEFFDLPITIAEMVAALPIVIEQAGGKKADKVMDASAGEANPHRADAMGAPTPATSGSMPSTGASSSPTSA